MDGIVTVSDDEVITAMKWIMERMKVNYYIIINILLYSLFVIYLICLLLIVCTNSSNEPNISTN